MDKSELARTLIEMIEEWRLAASCCDDPDDRMYHAADRTWWRRDGNRWVREEAPFGWVWVDSQEGFKHKDNDLDTEIETWLKGIRQFLTSNR